MKDDRLYARFTHDFAEHPKIKPLPDPAFRAYVEMILWSAHYLTDGVLPNEVALACWGLDRLNPLVACNLLQFCPSGEYLIHDFTEHQTTRAEVEHIRKVRKRAGRRGGLASAKNRASAEQELEQEPEQNRQQNQARTQKTEDRTLLSGYLGGEGHQSNAGALRNGADAPPPPCQKHPNGWDHTEPCRACAALRRWDEGREERETELRREAGRQRRAAIDACDRCDENGMRPARGGLTRCDHTEALEDAEVPW